jgi:hypothetical protein
MVVAAVIIALVLVALAWFFMAGEQEVGHLRFGEPWGAAPIIDLGILHETRLDRRYTSWTML